MRLSDLTSSKTAQLELIHPVSGPTGVVMTLLSRDSAEVQAMVLKAKDRRLLSLRGRRDQKITAAELDTEAMGILAASIAGWVGLDDLEYSPANAESLLRDHAWIRRQVDEALEDEALFFGH